MRFFARFLIGVLLLVARGQGARAADAAWQATWTVAGGVVPGRAYAATLQPPGDRGTPAPLALVFDTDDPPAKNPFNTDRNIEGKPAQEVAILVAGREVVRHFCPVPLAGAGGGHTALVRVEAVTGGYSVTVRVVGAHDASRAALVFDRYFVRGAFPAGGGERWAVGAAASSLHHPFGTGFTVGETVAVVSGYAARLTGSVLPATTGPQVVAFDGVVNDSKHHRNIAPSVVFPAAPVGGWGRVVCRLALAPQADGTVDKWDRVAQLFLTDPTGEQFEILRWITPYGRGYEWEQDVSDLQPLLTGTRKMETFCETYGPGWRVSVTFLFFPGPPDRGRLRPYKVVNLWNTTATVGQPDRFPLDKSLPPRTVAVDPKARQIRARFVVTGHGQAPNESNAAEFIPLWRRVVAGGTGKPLIFTDTLWKDDNYLNACRPQGGTWKYPRAGWAPGDVVAPWTVDLTPLLAPHPQTLSLRYEIEPFINHTPDNGNPARHIIASQVIFYQ